MINQTKNRKLNFFLISFIKINRKNFEFVLHFKSKKILIKKRKKTWKKELKNYQEF